MPGRRLCSEKEAIERGFRGPECTRRRAVLRETIEAFEEALPENAYETLAAKNLERWRQASTKSESSLEVRVLPGDWGEVTLALTREYGVCFAVLNMANAFVPGGAYIEGAVAQEENMFRRTNCHFFISEHDFDAEDELYAPEMTSLLSAADGRVYLDTIHPRVCIRGPENRSAPDLGYRWLADDEVFPFFELRASAQDLRDDSPFCKLEARRRIAAQFDTLQEQGVRHVVLGAFGCGAFLNPADQVAQIYRDEILQRRENFQVIAFAIFHAGYGPSNFEPFRDNLTGAL